MKSIISKIDGEAQVRNYPYLGEFERGDVVLFTSPNCGVCVVEGLSALGEYSRDWDEGRARFFVGTVSLSN
jgi:hypothetical protein